MNFLKLNNNIEPNRILMESGFQNKIKVETPVPSTVFGKCGMTEVQYNYNFDDEYSLVEKFDYDEDEKNNTKGKMWNNVSVVVEKLPDSVVQQYLAKKTKQYETLNFRQKLFDSTMQHSVTKENQKVDSTVANSPIKQNLAKKRNFETDKFVKELCTPIMQKYLANTEMGCLTDDFMEQIPEPQEYTAKVNESTIDSLIENLSGTDETVCSVQTESNDQTSNCLQQYSAEREKDDKADNSMKSLSYPTEQQCHVDLSYLDMEEPYVDVEKIDDIIQNPANFIEQENSNKKKSIGKKKSGSHHKRSRKNITTNLCKRICPNCQTYMQKAHKASLRIKCDECKTFTFYECNKCKKQVQTYSGISHHLLYQCDARTSYKCMHCHYSVKKKHALALHIKRMHGEIKSRKLISPNESKNPDITRNISDQSSEPDKRYENLIVLKKQKEMKCNSEWYIENVKRTDSRVDENIRSSVPTVPITLPVENPTSVEKMSQLYCDYCDSKIAIDSPYNKSEIYCRRCGTVLLFKCLKCNSTCESYHGMKHHLKKVCRFKENDRKSFYCLECNYRSFFEGQRTRE